MSQEEIWEGGSRSWTHLHPQTRQIYSDRKQFSEKNTWKLAEHLLHNKGQKVLIERIEKAHAQADTREPCGDHKVKTYCRYTKSNESGI